MSSDHKLLWNQVGSLAKDDRAVARAKDSLSGLFETAKRGSFNLGNDLFNDRRNVGQALAAALRQKSLEIVFVDIDDRKPLDPKVLSDSEILFLKQGYKLGPNLWQALWDKYHWAWQEGFRRGPGEAARHRIERALLMTVGRQLETAVWKTLEKSARWRCYRAAIFNGIWDAVVYYLGFVVLGDKKRAECLEPLIRALPRFLFFCLRDEKPDTWLALVG